MKTKQKEENLPVKIAIQAQEADLLGWERNLKPVAFKYLKQLVESKNESATDENDIIRGTGIYEVFVNKLLFKLYAEPRGFCDLGSFNVSREGIVLIGAGGDSQDWIDGVSQELYKEGITGSDKPFDQWSAVYVMKTSGGRTDLVLFFKEPMVHDISKMALWRLRFGDCSWWSDYVRNYSNQHALAYPE